MPGIVGLITKMPRSHAEAELRCMLGTLHREPFYSLGTYVDPSQGVYLGWTTRSGSFADGMPLRSHNGQLTLVFSGEDFQDPATLRTLRVNAQGTAASGARYLVALCESEPSFPACLNGRFHGVFVDSTRQSTTIFNDRFGLHRLYYHRSRDAFYFSAEAKSILAVRPEVRQLDERGFGEYVSCGCVLENRTLFTDVHVLPPASAWRFQNGALTSRRSYFVPAEWEIEPYLTTEEYYQQLRDVFSHVLARYCEPREKTAISLTGGLDTRMIMAWSRFPSGSVPCYTFGGAFRDNHDVRVARQVARICGQPHQVIVTGDDFLRKFPAYAERTVWLSEGCVDLSRSPDLYVNERAREIAPIRLTGNYGSEVLRGVRAFKPQSPAAELLSPDAIPFIERARLTYESLLDVHPLSFALFRQAPWHHYGLLGLEETQLSLRSPYLDNDFVRTVFRAPAACRRTNDVCLRLIADGDSRLARLRTDRGLGGATNPALRALTRGLLQLQFKAEYAYDYGMPHWLAGVDRALSPMRPERLFLGRHKSFHFRVWYRNALASYVREILLDARAFSRPYIQRRGLESVVLGHTTGRRNHTTEIHKALALELLHRLFIDGPVARSASFAGSPTYVQSVAHENASRRLEPIHVV